MNFLLLFVLCAGLFAKCSLADEENEVKRGAFPFMAFVYYSDKTIVDRTGSRLTRGAVLIRPDWLISSSLEDGQTSLAFPKETLLARLGAIRIDSKFSFNEDEEEQEREIIQIASSFNYNATNWWMADIMLLKALLPFNTGRSVAPFQSNGNPKTEGCFILIYSALNGNKSGDKLLMKLSVDMLQPDPENCGSNFIKGSMICAADGEYMKKESNFCDGNSGSPLICEGEVVGIQTYIDDCRPPHLFQDLRSWGNLIQCAVEDKCHEEECGTICNVINKDPPEQSPQHMLAEAKQYSEENVNRSGDAIVSPTSTFRRLLPDDSKTISENEPNKEIDNTETTTTSSSTVVYDTETEVISPMTENTGEEENSKTSTVLTSSVITESEKNYMYKNEELVKKVEELKTLIEENVSTDPPKAKEKQPQELSDPSSASVNTRCPCCFMFASLILFYLQISFIVNSF